MTLIPGYATAEATKAYAVHFSDQVGEGHFSDFLQTGIRLSSLGVGSFPGEPTEDVDQELARIVSTAFQSGINVIDTATHYRYGHSLQAIAMGIQGAIESGTSREAMFLVSKGGFLSFDGEPPEDMAQWLEAEIFSKGLGKPEDLCKGVYLLSPEYLRFQLTRSREQLGVETLDAFLVDQPEIFIPELGKERLNQRLLEVFITLEQAVKEGELRHYGVSTFEGFRVATDHPLFQSVTSLLGLAGKAAHQVWGDEKQHHLSLLQLPYNLIMSEGFTRFNQATGAGNMASTLQAAHQLGVFVMGSHTLMKGLLARADAPVMPEVLDSLPSNAQKAIQFARSTPGVGSALIGCSKTPHFEEVLSLICNNVLSKQEFVSMFEKV